MKKVEVVFRFEDFEIVKKVLKSVGYVFLMVYFV